MNRGEWRLGFLAQQEGLEELARLYERSYLKAELLGGLGTFWAWAGRYSEGERNVKEALEMTQQIEEVAPKISHLRDLGAILAAQGKYEEAEAAFTEGQHLHADFSEDNASIGLLSVFWGRALLRRGELAKAEEYIERARRIFEVLEKNYKWETLYVLISLGELYELQHDWRSSETPYQNCSTIAGSVVAILRLVRLLAWSV